MTNKSDGNPATTADGAGKLQFAALPYQINRQGTVRILMVTSRETGRWIIPKGWPMDGKLPHEAAAIEAFEEAGVVGEPIARSIGMYEYWKQRDSASMFCRVAVFPLPIDRLEPRWPEETQRERRFFDLETAASLVEEPSLKRLIASFRAPKET
jgi:8-oxo-dGTP pyrophosphatase MutT (NUDIX family)